MAAVLTVSPAFPIWQAVSAHVSPDPSLNRAGRCGKSSGSTQTVPPWWMRCPGMARTSYAGRLQCRRIGT